jgi:hypothetical protein
MCMNQKNESSHVPSDTTKTAALSASQSKKIIVIAGSIVLIGVLSILPVFAGSSLLSKSLDSLGLHKAAFGVDKLSSTLVPQSGTTAKGTLLQFDIDKISQSLKGDKSCASIWDDIKNKSQTIAASDLITGGSVTITTKDNKDILKVGAQIQAQGDVNNLKSAAQVRATAMVDSDVVVSTAKSLNLGVDLSKFNEGVISADAQARGVLTVDNGVFALSDLKVKSNSVNFNESLKNTGKTGTEEYNWYGSATELDAAQKSAVKDVSKTAQKLLSTKPSAVITDETGKAIAKFICSGVKDVDIQGVGEYTLGGSILPNKITARKVSIKAQNQSYAEMAKEDTQNVNAIIEALKKDQTLRAWLKSQYPAFKSLNDNGNIINKNTGNSDPAFASQSAWDASIDKGIDDLSTSAYGDDSQKIIDQIFAVIDLSVEKNDVYFNVAGEVVGAESTIAIKAKDGAAGALGLGGQVPASVLDLLKSKITINTFISKLSISENELPKEAIMVPSSFKKPEDIVGDLENKDSVKKFKQEVQPIIDSISMLLGESMAGGNSSSSATTSASSSAASLEPSSTPASAATSSAN